MKVKVPTIKNEEDAKKYVKELENKRLEEIETYMKVLNQYRQEGKGQPQWVLDKLEALGAPYGVLKGQQSNKENIHKNNK